MECFGSHGVTVGVLVGMVYPGFAGGHHWAEARERALESASVLGGGVSERLDVTLSTQDLMRVTATLGHRGISET